MKILVDISIKRACRRLVREKIELSRTHGKELLSQRRMYKDREDAQKREAQALAEKTEDDRRQLLESKRIAVEQRERELIKEHKLSLRAKDATISMLQDKCDELERRHREYRELREHNEAVASILSATMTKVRYSLADVSVDINNAFQQAQTQLEECDKIKHLDDRKSQKFEKIEGGRA